LALLWAWNEAANNRLKAHKKLEVEEAKQLQISKLNLEIGGRLSQFIVDVESMVAMFGYDKTGDAFQPVWDQFSERIMRGEWSTTFPYTDCKGSVPFC
jgi:hypothetical protein